MTKLQQLRISNHMSQSDLSKLSGVNYRTLQDFDQGRKSLANAKGEMLYRLSYALNCSIDDLLSDYVGNVYFDINENNDFRKRLESYTHKMTFPHKDLYGEYYTFPTLFTRDGIKMERIYPTKQKLVTELHDALTPIDDIVSVILFGSSVTMRCTHESDTDLSVRLREDSISDSTRNDISGLIQEICNYNADILWYDRISPDDRIYSDICKGVQIV